MAIEHLVDYLQTYGYLLLFFGTLLEGETFLILGGFFVHQGYFRPELFVLTSLSGAFLGDQLFFFVGKVAGRRIVRSIAFISKKMPRIEHLVHEYGLWIVLICKFMYGFRIVTVVALGSTSIKALRYGTISFFATLFWIFLFGIVGYLLGETFSLFLGDIKRYEGLLIIFVFLLGIALGLIHIVIKKINSKQG